MNILLSGEFEAAELHDWQQSLRAALPNAHWLDRDEALAVADTVQVAVVANPPPGSLHGLPKLRLIQSLWAGVDRLLLDPTLPPGVPIARMVDPAMNASMAETALWATLSLHRGYFDYAQSQRQGLWQPQPQRRADSVRRAGARPGPDGPDRGAAHRAAGLPRQRLEPAAAAQADAAGRHRLPCRRSGPAGAAGAQRHRHQPAAADAGHAPGCSMRASSPRCRAAPASSTWRAARTWSMPTCWPRSTAAIWRMRCWTCSTPSRCPPDHRVLVTPAA